MYGGRSRRDSYCDKIRYRTGGEKSPFQLWVGCERSLEPYATGCPILALIFPFSMFCANKSMSVVTRSPLGVLSMESSSSPW